MDGSWLTESQIAPMIWTPWYVHLVSDPAGVAWVWPVLQDVFELPDPERFPELRHTWTEPQTAILRQYVSVCERLVTGTALNSNARLTIHLFNDVIERDLPADDVTVGFATLLRQLFKSEEEASFNQVRGLVARAPLAEDVADAGSTLRLWKRARTGALREHHHALLAEMARKRGLADVPESSVQTRLFTTETITPQALLEIFLYGDLIHWGEGRETLERWKADPRLAAQMDLNMRQDAQTLAHFYAGFAGIVRAVLRGEGQA
jgi:hypothetical protein